MFVIIVANAHSELKQKLVDISQQFLVHYECKNGILIQYNHMEIKMGV
jgi:hypothetical protein